MDKMHWIGNVANRGTKREEVTNGAVARWLRFPDDALVMGYLIPVLLKMDMIEKDVVHHLAKGWLGATYPDLLMGEVWDFTYGKIPYRIKFVKAELDPENPLMRVRMGGWQCPKHRKVLHGDVPAVVLQRDEFRCVICGVDRMLLVDYNVRLSDGGDTHVRNLFTSCLSCHKKRGKTWLWPYLRKQGVPMDQFVVNFDTGYIRPVVSGGKIDF